MAIVREVYRLTHTTKKNEVRSGAVLFDLTLQGHVATFCRDGSEVSRVEFMGKDGKSLALGAVRNWVQYAKSA